ncbi:MAG: hypothetical protein NXI31_20615 [bacterium]|nr:hypothetical protein [bacterium]
MSDLRGVVTVGSGSPVRWSCRVRWVALALAVAVGAAASAQDAGSAAGDSAAAGQGSAESGPEYPRAAIAWRADELPLRIDTARNLCQRGEYDLAVALLQPAATGGGDASPADDSVQALARRVRDRAAEVVRLRAQLLAKAEARGLRLAPRYDGRRRGGRLVRHDAGTLTLRGRGGDVVLPMSALRPAELRNELVKHEIVATNAPITTWLRWLEGRDVSDRLPALPATVPFAKGLVRDCAVKIVVSPREAAVALARVLALEPAAQPEVAFQQMERLIGAIAAHRGDDLIAARVRGLRDCVRALAYRAFTPGSARCLPLAGQCEVAADGGVTVKYRGADPALFEDFRHDERFRQTCMKGWGRLATEERRFEACGDVAELIGDGLYRWRLPVAGPLTMELEMAIAGSGQWGLLAGTANNGAMLRVTMSGVMDLRDPATRIVDSLGKATVLTIGEPYRVRLNIDENGVATSFLNDRQVARATRIGNLASGYPALMTHCSMALHVHALTIKCRVDPEAGETLRGLFVERMAERVR